jgi:TonB family protein
MAQDASSWVKVAPDDEVFTVMMPQTPSPGDRKYQLGRMSVAGKLYSVDSDETLYRIWSLNDQARTGSSRTDMDSYLDSCADLVWESLLKPVRERIEKSTKKPTYMYYRRELAAGASPGREYSITMGAAQGVVHFYVTLNRIYVLVVMSPAYNSGLFDQFLKSFTTTNPERATLDVDPMLIAPGDRPIHYGNPPPTTPATGGNNATGGSIDASNRVFSPREVTQKARILAKPEPQYTYSARKYAVSGTVVLRAVFSTAGEVTNIRVVSKLPHGLTERSIAAARGIKFIPAIKDGRQVSQYIQIVYNFNLY